MPRVTVDKKYCKGCKLCVDVCPEGLFELDTSTITEKGYHPAFCNDETKCTACSSCVLTCPDIAIEIRVEKTVK